MFPILNENLGGHISLHKIVDYIVVTNTVVAVWHGRSQNAVRIA